MAIESFAHKGVEELFYTGRSKRIAPQFRKRMRLVLDAMSGATGALDLQGAHGFDELKGDRAGWYAVSVSGNWRLVFRFEHGKTGDVLDVDFLDYH
jgi:proteic killer suppression protein